MSTRTHSILFLTLLALVLLGAGCVRQAAQPVVEQPQPVAQQPQVPPQPPVTPPPPPPPPPPGPTDCGGNIQCVIAAALDNCRLAMGTFNFSGPHVIVDALAQKQGLTSVKVAKYYEVKGREGNNCLIYEKQLSGRMTYNQSKLAELVAGNPSFADQASKILESTNQAYDILAGKSAICKITGQGFKTKMDMSLRGDINISVSVDANKGESITTSPYKETCIGDFYKATTIGGSQVSECPSCSNCASGSMKNVTTTSGEVCKECLFDRDCKSEFSCVKSKCVAQASQQEGSPCDEHSDCPAGSHCAPQDRCVKNTILNQFDSCAGETARTACKSKTCTNCKSGTYACPLSSGPVNQKCVECFINLSCKSGFTCENYRCVPK